MIRILATTCWKIATYYLLITARLYISHDICNIITKQATSQEVPTCGAVAADEPIITFKETTITLWSRDIETYLPN